MNDEAVESEEVPTVLRCSACGVLARRLHSVRTPVRSLSLGRDVEAGDLVCDRCLQELEEEFSEEELTRGPA
jgi:hypothetical protein